MAHPPPQLNDPLIGQVLAGDYIIDALIAKGGMGNIYLAHQQRLGRPYAIKVLRAEFCEDQKVVKRFVREALAVSQLRHPHTVQVFDSGETPDGVHFIVMEYLEGESLDRRIARVGQLDPESAIRFIGQAAAALAEAHAKGMVHRDLKPANLFIVSAPDVPEFIKILDFGIAKFYTGAGSAMEFTKLTSAGSTMGTPHYMSPEQIRGEDVDGRADVYSLGVILWEALTGTPPFNGDSPMEVFLGHLEQQLPPISEVAPAVPPGFDAVMGMTLAKSVGARFPSARELKTALDSFLGADPSRLSVSQQLWLPSDLNPAQTPTAPEGSLRAVSGRSRVGLFVLMGIAAVAIVAIIGALVFALSGDNTPAKASTTSEEQDAEPQVALDGRGHIKVVSDPSGAEIWIDGELAGTTPVHLARGETDSVKLELRADGYRRLAVDITAVPTAVQGVAIALPPTSAESPGEGPMSLWIESEPPGASIAVNGESAGFVTPYALRLSDALSAAEGPIELTLEREGFLSESYAVVPRPGANMALSSTLVPSGPPPSR